MSESFRHAEDFRAVYVYVRLSVLVFRRAPHSICWATDRATDAESAQPVQKAVSDETCRP